ncbi:MAG TPA: cytochrome c oxidase subunit 3 [Silvibacterium sp.]|nr:cytochrome c oxidase subunit 3 [Silvibacterium sp.]
MSSTVQIPPPRVSLATLPLSQKRGGQAMWAVIATEFMLFVAMFGSYYYLGTNKDRWALNTPPSFKYPFFLLAILLASSAVIHWGEKRVKAEEYGAGRLAVWITVVMGMGFLALQGFEYADHWKTLTPYSNSYGSIFYALTTLHAAHVIAGLLLLMYLGVVPRYGPTTRTPHKIYHPVAMYWHFVDVVWILIVLLLYVVPHFQVHRFVN